MPFVTRHVVAPLAVSPYLGTSLCTGLVTSSVVAPVSSVCLGSSSVCLGTVPSVWSWTAPTVWHL